MIKVKVTNNRLAVEGHANYAPHGEDIVCAGISALFQTLVATIIEFELIDGGQWHYSLGPGNSYIEYKNGNEQLMLVIRSFILGASLIAEAYPQHVEIIDQACMS